MKKQNSRRTRGGNPARQSHRAKAHVADAIFAGSRANSFDAGRHRKLIAASKTRPLSVVYSREDRQTLLLMIAPFLILAVSLASQPILRTLPALQFPQTASSERTIAAPVAVPQRSAIPPAASIEAPRLVAPAHPVRLRIPVAIAPVTLPRSILGQPGNSVSSMTGVARATTEESPSAASSISQRAASGPDFAHPVIPPVSIPPVVFPHFDVWLGPSVTPSSPPAMREAALDRSMAPPALNEPSHTIAPTSCAAPGTLFSARAGHQNRLPFATPPQSEFGGALAAVARSQLNEFVIYNARYSRIGYPMGDVAPLYGVCTDVVIRAYRALGIDLQELIFKTKSGRGDINIDHRRVDVVRRFLERHGQILPTSDYAEDYQPGDIVTYYRPQNRASTAHIAVVSDQIAPSGRAMIIHNRGWGPQLEDALFVDKITGHFRFSGRLRDDRSLTVNASRIDPIAAPMCSRDSVMTRSALEPFASRLRGMSSVAGRNLNISRSTALPGPIQPASSSSSPPATSAQATRRARAKPDQTATLSLGLH